MTTISRRAAKLALGGLLAAIVAAAPLSAQPSIRVGQTVTGSLSATDPVLDDGSHFHLYQFRGEAGDVVTVTMRSADFDAYLAVGTLANGELTALDVDDDAGGGTDARLTLELPVDGTYGIHANTVAAGETGSYTLALEQGSRADLEPQEAAAVDRVDPARAVAIRPGPLARGTLSASDPVLDDGSHYDLYRFTVEPGQRVEATMRSGELDAFLSLGTVHGNEFRVIATDDDGASGTDARIRRTLGEGGTYYLRANSLGEGETGAYTLTLAVGPAPRPIPPTPLAVGRAAHGTLAEGDAVADDESYFDAYTFSARAGQTFVLTMDSDELDAFLSVGRMERGTYQELDSNDDGDDSGTNARLRFTAPAAGTYVVRANSLGAGETGRYTLRLSND